MATSVIAVYVNDVEKRWIEEQVKNGAKASAYLRALLQRDMQAKAKPEGEANAKSGN